MGKFCIETIKNNVLHAMSGISSSPAPARITEPSTEYRDIPHNNYYLIFLMMVDLLEYEYEGPHEKFCYGISLKFKGHIYTINYQKFGMRIICSKGGDGEVLYNTLVKGMGAAKPYFEWRADQASMSSDLNLESKCRKLWCKYQYFRGQSEILQNKLKQTENKAEIVKVGKGTTYSYLVSCNSLNQGMWMHEAAVDAFFAWCEQALVHIAILMGKLTSGEEIITLLKGEFRQKCKLVLNLDLTNDKLVYDDISNLRNELRNYVAHGSFGKDGSAFSFHTAIGAVPLNIVDNKSRFKVTFYGSDGRDWADDYDRIDKFYEQLWANGRAPAKQHLEGEFPCILTHASDGIYNQAMVSEADMEEYLEYLGRSIEDHWNMDW